MGRSRFSIGVLGLQLLLGVSLAVLLIPMVQARLLPGLLPHLLGWLQNSGWAGVIGFILLYNLATVLLLPASVLTLGGGALYGVVWGTIYVMVAATLGATLAFWIGRHGARGWVKRQLQQHPQFQAMDAVLAREGFRIVLLTRLSPLFPFNFLNYAFGVTQVSLKDYILGSVGLIPGTLMYVYMGSLTSDLATLGTAAASDAQAAPPQWGMRILGLMATAAVTVYAARIAKITIAQTLPTSALPPRDS